MKKKTKIYKAINRHLERVRNENFYTHRARISDLRLFCDWCENNDSERLKDITPELVQGFVADRLEIEAPATVQRRVAMVKRFLKRTFEELGIPSPGRDVSLRVSHRVKTLKLDRADVKLVSLAAYELGVNEFKKSRNRTLVDIYSNTGLRRAEVLRLNDGQVRLSDRVIVDTRVKGGKLRNILINDRLHDSLKEYYPVRKKWLEGFGAFSNNTQTKKNLFPLMLSGQPGTANPKSWRMVDVNAYRVIKRAGQALGLEISPHDLRHFFAHKIYEASGYNIRVAQEALGHSSSAVTEKYLGVSQLELKQFINFEG